MSIYRGVPLYLVSVEVVRGSSLWGVLLPVVIISHLACDCYIIMWRSHFKDSIIDSCIGFMSDPYKHYSLLLDLV